MQIKPPALVRRILTVEVSTHTVRKEHSDRRSLLPDLI